MRKTVVLILVVLFVQLIAPSLLVAKTETEYNTEIAQLEAKITAAKNSGRTLSNQISYYDDQIALANIKIDQTVDQIKSYAEKIDLLEEKLSAREQLLMRQIVSGYKQQRIQPLESLIGEGSFRKFLASFKYNRLLQSQSRKFLYDTQYIQTTYKDQKILVETSQVKLQKQKVLLSGLREQKNQLLTQTKNDEATYQKLLAQAKAERDSLKAFALSRGGGLLPPQPSPDGWYQNQRDERWGRQCIGTTCSDSNPSYVWEVGCLITSISMLWKKNGAEVTPADFAKNTSYFFEDMLLIPWPVQSGFKFSRFGRDFGKLDAELSAGRPVIAELYTGNAVGGKHFVVIKNKDGGNYTMNDPWEGPDLKFTQFYSTGSIISLSSYTRM